MFFRLLFLVTLLTAASAVTRMFHMYRVTTDDMARDALAPVVVINVLDCVKLCGNTDGCLAVNYKVSTTECQMLKVAMGVTTTVEVAYNATTDITVPVTFTPACDMDHYHVARQGDPALPQYSQQCTIPCSGAENVECATTCVAAAWTRVCAVTQFVSCVDAYDKGHRRNGIYNIKPDAGAAFDVVCDMDITVENYNIGGWTVVYNSDNTGVEWSGKYEEQKELMGDLNADFFIGLRKLHRITLAYTSMATFDIVPYSSEYPATSVKKYARYMTFEVGAENTNFKLTATTYQGTAGDSMNSGNQFTWTATDHDTDHWAPGNCADYNLCQGGWYQGCSTYCFLGRRTGQLAGYAPIRYGHNFWAGLHWHWSLKQMRFKLR